MSIAERNRTRKRGDISTPTVICQGTVEKSWPLLRACNEPAERVYTVPGAKVAKLPPGRLQPILGASGGAEIALCAHHPRLTARVRSVAASERKIA